MKKDSLRNRLSWISLVLLFWSVTPMSAEQFGLFTYEVVEGSVTITDYPNNGVGEVEIPAEIEGRPVSSIGAAAFRSCDGLTDITIPTQVWHGALDRSVQVESARAMAEAIPGAQFHVLENQGRYPVIECWQEFVEALAGSIPQTITQRA